MSGTDIIIGIDFGTTVGIYIYFIKSLPFQNNHDITLASPLGGL